MIVAIGCSGSDSPTSPNNSNDTSRSQVQEYPDKSLWGFFDGFMDLENGRMELVQNRSAAFALNVVTFLNSNPVSVQTNVNQITTGNGYIDVDVNVTIAHPLNLEVYDGYDVFGVFIGNGSASLMSNSSLVYPAKGIDQVLLNADGYLRWYNPTEFKVPGAFGYTQGI